MNWFQKAIITNLQEDYDKWRFDCRSILTLRLSTETPKKQGILKLADFLGHCWVEILYFIFLAVSDIACYISFHDWFECDCSVREKPLPTTCLDSFRSQGGWSLTRTTKNNCYTASEPFRKVRFIKVELLPGVHRLFKFIWCWNEPPVHNPSMICFLYLSRKGRL